MGTDFQLELYSLDLLLLFGLSYPLIAHPPLIEELPQSVVLTLPVAAYEGRQRVTRLADSKVNAKGVRSLQLSIQTHDVHKTSCCH